MRRLLVLVSVCALAASASGDGGPYFGPAGQAPRNVEDWSLWWRHNEREIVAPVRAGRSARDDDAVRAKIAPTLRAFLADDAAGRSLRSASAIALAKLGDESIVTELKDLATNADKSLPRDVPESAALALGLLGRADPTTRAFLVDLVRDRERDGTFVRAFAAVSLGLLGDDDRRTTACALLDVVRGPEENVDVKPACLLALGLLADARAVPELLAMATRDDALTETERSYAVAAIGMIAGDENASVRRRDGVLDALTALVVATDAARELDVRRSAAIALGRVAPRCSAPSTRRAVDDLRGLVKDADAQTRDFAIISLGRIAAATTTDATTRADAVDFLAVALRSASGFAPSYAALALGIVGRDGVTDDVRDALRLKFRDEQDARLRGAYALASGLTFDLLAADPLVATLSDRATELRVRGACALALGMIGDADAVEPIRTTLRDQCDRDLRVQCATALRLLGDFRAVDDMIDVLHDRDASNYELGSAALALGRLGDPRAVDALLEVAVDADKFPDLTRALAVTALGEIGDRSDVPALARLTTDVNYRARVPAITELPAIR